MKKALLALLVFCISGIYQSAIGQVPVITGYTQSTGCAGRSIVFTVTATNNPTSYYWYFWTGDAQATATGPYFSGTTTAALTVNDSSSWAGGYGPDNEFQLMVVAFNASGQSSYYFITTPLTQKPSAVPVVNFKSSIVCAGADNVLYTIESNTNFPSVAWSYSGTGATIVQPVDTAIEVSFSSTATSGVFSVTGQDSCGLGPATTIPVIVNSQQVAIPAAVSGGPAVCDSHDASIATYADPTNCSIIASILPSGANPLSGSVQSCVTVDASVQSYSSMPYVTRHFNLVPAANASTATGTVTLYFNQSDFDSYNAARGSSPALPTGPTDATGAANLRVTAFNGTGTTPASYPTTIGVITPGSNNVVWNAASSRWEVSFTATGFGGFFVSGDSLTVPPPVILGEPGNLMLCSSYPSSGNIGLSSINGTSYNWQLSSDQGDSWTSVAGNAAFTNYGNYITVYGNDTLNNDLMRCIVSNSCGADTSANATITENAGLPGAVSFVHPDTVVCQGQTQLYSITGAPALDSIFFSTSEGSYFQSNVLDSNVLVHFNVAPGTYDLYVRVVNACGFSPQITLPITVNPATTDSANALATTECSSTPVYPTATTMYADSTCNGIGAILPSGASPVSGNVQTCVTVQPVVQTYNGIPYVPRYYDLEPASNASTSTATITLYFTQADFDAYNAARGSFPALPTGPSDSAGISHLSISQFHGSGTTPDTYVGGSGTITPTSVAWDASYSRWEVTFNITGFSGFFVSGNPIVPLPLTLTSFTGVSTAAGNQLHWETSMEENTAYFDVERAITGGGNFLSLDTVPAAGNSEQPLTYTYTDAQAGGTSYSYRLKMVDLDATFTYSKIITLQSPAGSFAVSVSPNPYHQSVSVIVTMPEAAEGNMVVTDVAGHRIIQQALSLQKGSNTLNPTALVTLAPGMYFLSITTGQEKQTVKLIRE
jgi:hypothetical protein